MQRLLAEDGLFGEFYCIFVGAAGKLVDGQSRQEMIQGFQAEFHAIFQPARIENVVGNCGYFLETGKLPDRILWGLLENNQGFHRYIGILAIW